jgi:hypothetical protein
VLTAAPVGYVTLAALELADGQRILIGSRRAEELARAIGGAKGQA